MCTDELWAVALMGPVILWWLVMEGLGLIALPFTFGLFGPGSAHGYPFTKILALLVLTYFAWLASYFLPAQTAISITLSALVVTAASLAWAQRMALLTWLRGGGLTTVARLNLLWTFGFLFFAWQRSMAPDIFGAEKYMDFSFFNSLERGGGMPPEDPWMAGHPINYYYFGYLTFANLARLVPLPTYISYNLCVATIGGLAFAETGAVVFQITKRWRLAVLGSAMSALVGNLDGFLQWVEKGTLRGMDYWRSSRVVGHGDTINEFPFFSTIHGDLHPHFMVLPVGIMLLGLLLDERLFPSRVEDQPRSPWRALVPWAFAAFVLGSMIVISPWEAPAGLMVVFLLAGRRQPPWPLVSKQRLILCTRVAATLIIGLALFLPFYLQFESFGQGVGFKIASTRLPEFATVFGLLLFAPCLLIGTRAWRRIPGSAEWRQFLAAGTVLAVLMISVLFGNAVLPILAALCIAGLAVAYSDAKEEERGGFLLIVAALVMLLVCEVAYLRDSYGAKLYRMNTVFKFYFQAWTMLAIAAPWATGKLLGRQWRRAAVPAALTTAIGALVVASACYPIGLTWDRLGRSHWTLDGNAYLAQHHPDDFAAISWLREHVSGRAVILEATGNPYSYFARFSSNTGLPTVLGWANHEGLWRLHDPSVGARRADVVRMYNAPSLVEIGPLLDRYDVRYVAVGELERREYKPAGLEKFASLNAVFRRRGTVIYERMPAGLSQAPGTGG